MTRALTSMFDGDEHRCVCVCRLPAFVYSPAPGSSQTTPFSKGRGLRDPILQEVLVLETYATLAEDGAVLL